MDVVLLVAALTASATGVPDEFLITALGNSHYHTREWAQTALYVRASTDIHPPVVAKLLHAVNTTPSYEVRARAVRVIGTSRGVRFVNAYAHLDAATGRSYPCADARFYNHTVGTYVFPEGGYYEATVIPDDAPSWLAYTSGTSYPAYRYASRVAAATALVDGWDPAEVFETLWRYHQVDALYYIRSRRPWDGPIVPYVLAAFRWDCP